MARSHRTLPAFFGLTAALLLPAQAPSHAADPVASNPLPTRTAELFDTTRIWNLHLRFERAQWDAMEPDQEGAFPFGGPPPSPGRPPNRGPGGPGGPGVRGGPGGGFPGPGMFLAPAFLAQGDQNSDGALAREEFARLGEKWFSTWDTNQSGRLDTDRLRSGLNASLGMPGIGGPPGGGPGGGPGGPGGGGGGGVNRPPGGGIGFSLQGPEGKRNGLASMMGIEFEYVRADLEFENARFTNVAVRYKGNGTFVQSRGSLKRSLKIDLNEFVKGQKIAGISKLNLHNCVTDPSWMNEVLSHRAYRDAGIPAPRTAYARVHVSVPGLHDRTYLGLYSLVENIDANFADHQFGHRKGALFKPVTPSLFTDLGEDWSKYRQTYDPKTDLTPDQQGRVIEFAKLVTHADDATFARELPGFLDLDRFARYMAVTVWIATLDSILGPGQNYYLYLDSKTRKFEFLPWDLDHSFGQFPMMGSQEQREKLSLHRPWQAGDNRFLDRVFKVDAFKNRYLSALEDVSRTVLRPDRLASQVDELGPVLRPAVQQESEEKLARFDQVVAGQTPTLPSGLGFGGPGFPGFEPPKPIKGFVTARAASVAAQLAGTEQGEVLGRMGMGMGGRRGGGPGRSGGADFGPGTFLAEPFRDQLDADKDQKVSHQEFTEGFGRWFTAWDTDKNASLSGDELREGLSTTFAPPPGFRFPGGPAPGTPPRQP